MRPQISSRFSASVFLLTYLCAGSLHAQTDTAEGLILTVARSQDLARAALHDAVLPVGSMLDQIGPSSIFLADDLDTRWWSISMGVTASSLSMTSPDYTVADPYGDDKIEGGVGAASADLSMRLFRGYSPSPSVTTAGRVDVLLRLGYSLGDQENLADSIDLGSWAPIYGGGLRIGLLKGPRLPSVSLAAGANHFTRRIFAVEVEGEDASVELDFEQTSAFLLLEVGKSLGWFTPYAVVGTSHQRLQASYLAEIVYGDDSGSSAVIYDAVDDKQTVKLIYGGLELGSGFMRFTFEGGVTDDEPFGRMFLRFNG